MALVDYSCDTFANREEIMSGERLYVQTPFVYQGNSNGTACTIYMYIYILYVT